jgi:hypothetical protein
VRNKVKTTFRIATTLAGAAVGIAALTSAAAAAPAAAKPATAKSAAAKHKAVPAANQMNPHDCIATDTHQVHFYWPNSAKHPTPTCVGGSGTAWFDNKKGIVFFGVCAGNNSIAYAIPGQTFFLSPSGAEKVISVRVVGVSLNGESGHATCPQ